MLPASDALPRVQADADAPEAPLGRDPAAGARIRLGKLRAEIEHVKHAEPKLTERLRQDSGVVLG